MTPLDAAGYRAAIEEERAQREMGLRDPTGWLSLVGLRWLHDGEQQFGASPTIIARSAASAAMMPSMSEKAMVLLPALRRARDLIDREYAEPLDLGAMARIAGYSRFHFARTFATAYGETPRAYLTRRRIERAKTLLRTANLSVTEICFLVGFASLGSFSARFRKLVGSSPSEYRDDSVARTGAPPIPGCVVLMWTRPHPDVEQSGRSTTGPDPATVVHEPQSKEHR